MIWIVKPVNPPKILTTKGAEQTERDCADYDDSPTNYSAGKKLFVIDSKIYRSESVKRVLRRAQYNKCAYCESKFLSTSYGAVEHYRPKGAVQQARRQRKEYPGYYWLAYDWNNLLFICTVCNTKKGELFPLTNDSGRARNHLDDIRMEQPLLLNPTIENPRDHIRFREGAPVFFTEIGRITIQVLDLERGDLDEARRERLTELKRLRDIIELEKGSANPNAQTLLQQVREYLATAVLPEAEYSSMARDFLDSNG